MARTLLDIKTEAATYFQLANGISDFTINSQDLFLMAANHVRQQAELAHDLEFLRKLVDVTVSGSTGGSLLAATDHVTTAATTVKTICEVGLYDTLGNFRPTDWGPAINKLEEQREQNPMFFGPRYPADGEVSSWPRGYGQFRFSGNDVFKWPKTDTAASESYLIGIECFTISADWTATDLGSAVVVTGTGTPDYNGTYVATSALSNAQIVYVLTTATGDTSNIILFDGSFWELFSALNGRVGPVFLSPATALAATYTADNGAVGTKVVAGAASTSDTWTTYGAQYLLWATIVYLNHRFKEFVFRTEGNLPPPQQLRDEALAAFIEWDTDRYTKFRREYR